jgi:hypothetical protein
MTRDLASLKNHEQFTKLFQLASKEQDQDKVGALFEEILGLHGGSRFWAESGTLRKLSLV